jgi:hypothetical protein
VAHWEAERRGTQPPAQLLEAGARALQPREDTIVLVGGDSSQACWVDLRLPRISAADIRGALRFELEKHSPIPVDDLQWGYRVLGRAPGSELNLVRIAYLRMAEWTSWLEAASGIGSGVDMIIPASAALDPVLGDRAVCWGTAGDGALLLVADKVESGGREMHWQDAAAAEPGDVFGLPGQPLRHPELNPGVLDDLPPGRQRDYLPAVMLGMYGLSGEYHQDHRHWPGVPVEMRPRRNQVQKLWTMAAAVYLFFILGILASAKLHGNHTVLQQIEGQIAAVERQIEDLRTLDADAAMVEALAEELQTTKLAPASLTATLAATTNLVGRKLWLTNFTWDKGDMRLDLRATADEPDLTEDVMTTPLLADRQLRKRVLPDGAVQYTIDCRALPIEGNIEDVAPPVDAAPEAEELSDEAMDEAAVETGPADEVEAAEPAAAEGSE